MNPVWSVFWVVAYLLFDQTSCVKLSDEEKAKFESSQKYLTEEQARALNPETGKYDYTHGLENEHHVDIQVVGRNGITIGCYGTVAAQTTYYTDKSGEHNSILDLDTPIDMQQSDGKIIQIAIHDVLPRCTPRLIQQTLEPRESIVEYISVPAPGGNLIPGNGYHHGGGKVSTETFTTSGEREKPQRPVTHTPSVKTSSTTSAPPEVISITETGKITTPFREPEHRINVVPNPPPHRTVVTILPPPIGPETGTTLTGTIVIPEPPPIPNTLSFSKTPPIFKTPSIPETPSIPNTPSFLNTPSIPETPLSFPKIPAFPNIPAIPKTPSIPEPPSIPNTPSFFKTASIPEIPLSFPKIPAFPNIPAIPKTPSIPERPSIPNTPSFLNTPSIPKISSIPTSPPSIPKTPPSIPNHLDRPSPSFEVYLPPVISVPTPSTETEGRVDTWTVPINTPIVHTPPTFFSNPPATPVRIPGQDLVIPQLTPCARDHQTEFAAPPPLFVKKEPHVEIAAPPPLFVKKEPHVEIAAPSPLFVKKEAHVEIAAPPPLFVKKEPHVEITPPLLGTVGNKEPHTESTTTREIVVNIPSHPSIPPNPSHIGSTPPTHPTPKTVVTKPTPHLAERTTGFVTTHVTTPTPTKATTHKTTPILLNHGKTPLSFHEVSTQCVPDVVLFTKEISDEYTDPFPVSFEHCTCTCPNVKRVPTAYLQGINRGGV